MATPRSARGPTREAVQSECHIGPIKGDKKISSYFNAARQLLIQGETYQREGEFVLAYVYIKRFLNLVVAMPEHKKYTRDNFANDRMWLKRESQRIFPVLESICEQIDAEDERRARASATRASSEAAAENKRRAAAGGLGGTTLGYSLDDLPEVPTGAPYSSKSGRRGSGGSAVTAAVMPPLYPPPADAAPAGLYAPSAPPLPSAGDFYSGYGGEAAVAAAGGGVGGAAALQDAFRRLKLDQDEAPGGHYPSVPSQERDPPPMQRGVSAFGKERKVVLPSTLVEEFEKIAQPNTDLPPYGIETCGILAGKLTHNVLQMTTLIIPKQKGTANSVETEDETELFNYMLPKQLITLGWIHTHPKQECFMSSVDVHTHCGYQLMLPEAVAVVYAPNDNTKRMGVFRLTTPDGMKLIQECELKGFHKHPENIKIYDKAEISWAPLPMTITDLR